ncbi:MAG: hypothetical protein AB7Y46_05020 [Armatimonadota bacterium]
MPRPMPMAWIIALLAPCVVAGAQGEVPAKKLIAVGWDMPNAERLRANLQLMEQRPLQGCAVRFAGPGNAPNLWFSFSREPYDEQVVAQFLQDLQAVEPQRLTHRFLLLNANPGDVDWFDDEGWAVIVEHWRTGARVARQGGLTGIMFDPEAYREPWRVFDWSAQPQADQHSFAEYREMARRRGRELMAAVAGEYPDITIFSLFMLSAARAAAERPDPVAALGGSPYGLLPSLIDGWLDVAPQTAVLVDGCEQAYRFNSRLEYLAAGNAIRNTCLRLISPENRYKYRAQVQVSFGVYLDAYVNPPDSPWHIDPGEQTPAQRLAENLACALEVADEYVWLYGEQASWWPSPISDQVRWPEKFPGIEEALWLATDPRGYALRLVQQHGEEVTNLIVNGDFSAATAAAADVTQPTDWQQGVAPPAWSFWQAGISEGRPGWDREVGHDAPGSGTLVGVKSGCLIQRIDVRPGERYVVTAWQRVRGAGAPSIRVRWQTAEGTWHAEPLDRFLSAPAGADDWQQLAGIVTVPEGAGKLVVLLQAEGQRSEDDVIWWDDVAVFRMQ